MGSIEEARSLSWQDLLFCWMTCPAQDVFAGTPVIDGWVLTGSLEEMALKGKYHHIPCLPGYTAMEGLPATPGFQNWWSGSMERARDCLTLCGGEEGFPSCNKDHCTIYCRAAVEAWAQLLAEQKAAFACVYCLSRQLPGDDKGSFHASDLWYVFRTLTRFWRPWEKEDSWLACACNTYWPGLSGPGSLRGTASRPGGPGP